MSDAFHDLAMSKVVNNRGKFVPMAHYDPDGDCIEFLISDESYYGVRVDSLVTVYHGQESGEIVGSLIKGVKQFINAQLQNMPGLAIEIEAGSIKLNHIFLAKMWSSDNRDGTRLTYRKLYEVADKAAVEAQFFNV